MLSDGAGFNGLTESAGVYTLSGTAGAVTKELDALVFTPNTFDAKTTFTLVDTTLFGTTSLATSQPNSNTTVIVTNGEPVVASVSMYLADPSKYDGTPGGFDILGTAAAITANLDPLDDPNIDAITISDNGDVGAAVQQLTTDATAIGKLQNANFSPVLLAVNDTAADIEAGLSTLVADAGEIGSITASDGPIVVPAATFLADQSALDKIVGGFDVSDKAANLGADLDQLNDPNISAITISDNGQISASVAQLTTDATAIGNLQNANSSPVLLAIDDTAADIETGLPTLVADAGEIGSIAASDGPIVVSAATALSDQSTLDKVVGGVDVSDTAANLVANLPALNADSTVAAITDFVGDATLSGGVGVNAPSFSEAFGANLTVGEALTYAGEFSQDSGSETAINVGDTFSLTGTASLSGETTGAGTLALAGGSATIESGATITTSTWMISGAGTDVTLDENLTYAGSFSEGAGDTFALSGGSLLLSGAASFAGGTVDGSNVLETEGTTTVSGLTIGGTVEWENASTVNESGGSATIGDTNRADQAFLFNTPGAAYDILDDSGIGVGASTASYLKNGGLLEKTGGTGTSAIASIVSNNGTLEVSSGTLDFQAGILSGTGSDIISGAATLEFDKRVSAGQTTSFTGSGGTLDLTAPATFAGVIGGFDTGAGSNDTIEVGGPFVFTGFTENAGGTQGSLGFTNPNTSAQISLTLLGDYNPANFVHQSGPQRKHADNLYLRPTRQNSETDGRRQGRHRRLPSADDYLYFFQATIPHLTRSGLHRCLQRHGIGRLPDLEGDKTTRRSSSLIRSPSSTSTSPKCRPPKGKRDCQESCAGPVAPSRLNEPFVEHDSELGLCLEPLARRHFPLSSGGEALCCSPPVARSQTSLRAELRVTTAPTMSNVVESMLECALWCFPHASQALTYGTAKRQTAPKDRSKSLIYLRQLGED